MLVFAGEPRARCALVIAQGDNNENHLVMAGAIVASLATPLMANAQNNATTGAVGGAVGGAIVASLLVRLLAGLAGRLSAELPMTGVRIPHLCCAGKKELLQIRPRSRGRR